MTFRILKVSSVLLLAFGLAHSAKADSCNGIAAAKNLVTNCGFETGTFAGYTGTATANTFSSVDNIAPYSGTYETSLGSIGSTDTLTQTLATIAGTNYNIQFELFNDTTPTTGSPNSFAVLFGGATLFSEINAPADAYTLYSFNAVATGNTTDLSFVSRNDPGFFELDSISVAAAASATPEPSSLILLCTGLLGVAVVSKRRHLGQSLAN